MGEGASMLLLACIGMQSDCMEKSGFWTKKKENYFGTWCWPTNKLVVVLISTTKNLKQLRFTLFKKENSNIFRSPCWKCNPWIARMLQPLYGDWILPENIFNRCVCFFKGAPTHMALPLIPHPLQKKKTPVLCFFALLIILTPFGMFSSGPVYMNLK